MKTLVLIRHAKSSWKDSSLADYDRPLNKRGKRDAPLMGEVIAAKNLLPDLFWVSPAKRATKTAQKIAQQMGYDEQQIIYQDCLYFGGKQKILELIQAQASQTQTIYIVSHNPDLNDLAEYFLGNFMPNIPTAGIVAFEFEVESWAQIGKGQAKMLFFEYPKKFIPQHPNP
jgi:phosphohistidine phosphatase